MVAAVTSETAKLANQDLNSTSVPHDSNSVDVVGLVERLRTMAGALAHVEPGSEWFVSTSITAKAEGHMSAVTGVTDAGQEWTLALTPQPEHADFIAACDPGSVLVLLDEIGRLTELVTTIGQFAASHSGRDGQDVLLAAVYRIAEECEAGVCGGLTQDAEPKQTTDASAAVTDLEIL